MSTRDRAAWNWLESELAHQPALRAEMRYRLTMRHPMGPTHVMYVRSQEDADELRRMMEAIQWQVRCETCDTSDVVPSM
jgi:hypothetical protein